MIREFFLERRWGEVWFAWFGLLVVIGQAFFSSYIKYAVNTWYTGFYDLLQKSGSALLAKTAVAAAVASNGTNATAGHHVLTLEEGRAQVWERLKDFGWIVLPAVFVSPSAKWVKSNWALRWRMTLMRSYIASWDANVTPVEGASQRLHEDTQRFATALQTYLALMLDSAMTLVVFTPILFELGGKVAAPSAALNVLGRGWMFVVAVSSAALGLGVAMVAGSRLVDLEVANQRVEAELRRELVVLEATPGAICAAAPSAVPSSFLGHGKGADGVDAPRADALAAPAPGLLGSPAPIFERLWTALVDNYTALYRNFWYLNLWLYVFDQLMVVAPYLLAAPLLFAEDAAERITLGTLVQTSNAFGRVFDSLSVVSENWGGINEWRSTLVRLRQFEKELYSPSVAPSQATRPSSGPSSETDDPLLNDEMRAGGSDAEMMPVMPKR